MQELSTVKLHGMPPDMITDFSGNQTSACFGQLCNPMSGIGKGADQIWTR